MAVQPIAAAAQVWKQNSCLPAVLHQSQSVLKGHTTTWMTSYCSKTWVTYNMVRFICLEWQPLVPFRLLDIPPILLAFRWCCILFTYTILISQIPYNVQKSYYLSKELHNTITFVFQQQNHSPYPTAWYFPALPDIRFIPVLVSTLTAKTMPVQLCWR